MKKVFKLLVIMLVVFSCTSCGKTDNQSNNTVPGVSQMKSICELATMDCYYHNVVKIKEEDVEGILFWKKDKHFWIEYSGIVTVGIDASKLNIEVSDNVVIITMPPGEIFDCKVDQDSLTKDSYIVDKDSVDINALDQTEAFKVAQEDMKKTVAADSSLLMSAQQRAQLLLEGYVKNLGDSIGREYTIKWVYLEDM